MADRAYGAHAELLGAFESTYGTLPAQFTKLQFYSTTLSEEKSLSQDDLLGLGRDVSDPFYEAPTTAGDLNVPLDIQSAGFWLKGLFGDPVSDDNLDGTYDHVFTSGGSVPSLSFETGYAALTPAEYFRHTGVKLGTFQFDMARSGPARASISAIAQAEATAAATIDAAPDTFTLTRFNQSNGAIKLGGTQLGSVTGGSFNYDNSLEPIETIRADQLIDAVDEREARVSGSMTVRYSNDSTIRDAVDAEAPVALEYSFTRPGAEGYKLVFAVPRIFLPKPKKEISGPGGIEASYDWIGAYDSTAGHALQVTLTNNVASY